MQAKMMIDKAFYPLDEAATLLGHKPSDLIHLAAIEEIVLLVGVNDDIRFRTYDASADRTEMPALLEPQLLALTPSQCQKIELNGRTEQSDFRIGYLMLPDGNLQQLMPSYGGRLRLDHGWAFWRTYKGPYIKELELTVERLFVRGEDVRRILVSQSQLTTNKKPKKKEFKPVEVPETVPSSGDLGIGDKTTINTANQSIKKDCFVDKSNAATSGTPVVETSMDSETPLIILRMPEVIERTGLSKSTIYDKLDSKSPRHDPTFPKRRNLGTNAVGWVQSEIESWLQARPVNGIGRGD